MFSTLPYTNFSFSVTYILLSANAFNFLWSKILLYGKGLWPLSGLSLSLLPVLVKIRVQINFDEGKYKNAIGLVIFLH